MKAWLLKEFRGLDALELAEVDDPVAGPNEVRLKVRFSSLNPADRYLAEGQYPAKPKLPHILGRDAVGIVDQVGPGVANWKEGDLGVLLRGEVGVERWGTFAQRVVVPRTHEQAAGAPLVYLTAYQALTQWGELPRESAVLVTGASGGVGIATIQLARAMGLRPLGLSRGADRFEQLKSLGAEACFDPTDENFPALIKQHLKDRRVDLAVDNVAGPVFANVIATVGDRGKVSVVGRQAGVVPNFNTGTLFFRRLRISGVAVGAYTNQEARDSWDQVVRLLSTTGARPVIDQVFPFEQLPKAFEHLWDQHLGKVLLAVNA
jgi:NADPH2:quinone reductase